MIDLSPTYLQYINFVKLFLWGMVPALVVSITHFLKLLSKKNYIITFILDFILTISTTILFLYLVNKYNYGETRFYMLLSFLLGFILFLFTIGKLIAKLNKIVYTNLCKLQNKFTKTKIGKVLNR